jgi:hypothetical protein
MELIKLSACIFIGFLPGVAWGQESVSPSQDCSQAGPFRNLCEQLEIAAKRAEVELTKKMGSGIDGKGVRETSRPSVDDLMTPGSISDDFWTQLRAAASHRDQSQASADARRLIRAEGGAHLGLRCRETALLLQAGQAMVQIVFVDSVDETARRDFRSTFEAFRVKCSPREVARGKEFLNRVSSELTAIKMGRNSAPNNSVERLSDSHNSNFQPPAEVATVLPRSQANAQLVGANTNAQATAASPVVQSTKLVNSPYVGVMKCQSGKNGFILLLNREGLALHMDQVEGHDPIWGVAGSYAVINDRILVSMRADNFLVILGPKYQVNIPEKYAWKRSAINATALREYEVRTTSSKAFEVRTRVRNLATAEIIGNATYSCAKLDNDGPVGAFMVQHLKWATGYLSGPVLNRFETEKLDVAREIAVKRSDETEWFKKLPIALKAIAGRELLDGLERIGGNSCATSIAAFKAGFSRAMQTASSIASSGLAKANPEQAEALAAQQVGQQLDIAFSQYLSLAGSSRCLVGHTSLVGF